MMTKLLKMSTTIQKKQRTSVLRRIPGVKKRSLKEGLGKSDADGHIFSKHSLYRQEFVSAAFFTTASASTGNPFAESYFGDSLKYPGRQMGMIIKSKGK